jgi:hypothetical protein
MTKKVLMLAIMVVRPLSQEGLTCVNNDLVMANT